MKFVKCLLHIYGNCTFFFSFLHVMGLVHGLSNTEPVWIFRISVLACEILLFNML